MQDSLYSVLHGHWSLAHASESSSVIAQLMKDIKVSTRGMPGFDFLTSVRNHPGLTQKAIRLGFSKWILRTTKFSAAFEAPYAVFCTSFSASMPPMLPAPDDIATNFGRSARLSSEAVAWNSNRLPIVLTEKWSLICSAGVSVALPK